MLCMLLREKMYLHDQARQVINERTAVAARPHAPLSSADASASGQAVLTPYAKRFLTCRIPRPVVILTISDDDTECLDWLRHRLSGLHAQK